MRQEGWEWKPLLPSLSLRIGCVFFSYLLFLYLENGRMVKIVQPWTKCITIMLESSLLFILLNLDKINITNMLNNLISLKKITNLILWWIKRNTFLGYCYRWQRVECRSKYFLVVFLLFLFLGSTFAFHLSEVGKNNHDKIWLIYINLN